MTAMSRTPSPDGARGQDDYGSKAAYKLLLRVVDYQTGGPDETLPAMVSGGSLYGTLVSKGDLSHEQADTARRAALQNDDLLKWPGPEGRDRYALVEDDALRDVIEEQANRENPDRELIATCNKLRTQLGGSGDDGE